METQENKPESINVPIQPNEPITISLKDKENKSQSENPIVKLNEPSSGTSLTEKKKLDLNVFLQRKREFADPIPDPNQKEVKSNPQSTLDNNKKPLSPEKINTQNNQPSLFSNTSIFGPTSGGLFGNNNNTTQSIFNPQGDSLFGTNPIQGKGIFGNTEINKSQSLFGFGNNSINNKEDKNESDDNINSNDLKDKGNNGQGIFGNFMQGKSIFGEKEPDKQEKSQSSNNNDINLSSINKENEDKKDNINTNNSEDGLFKFGENKEDNNKSIFTSEKKEEKVSFGYKGNSSSLQSDSLFGNIKNKDEKVTFGYRESTPNEENKNNIFGTNNSFFGENNNNSAPKHELLSFCNMNDQGNSSFPSNINSNEQKTFLDKGNDNNTNQPQKIKNLFSFGNPEPNKDKEPINIGKEQSEKEKKELSINTLSGDNNNLFGGPSKLFPSDEPKKSPLKINVNIEPSANIKVDPPVIPQVNPQPDTSNKEPIIKTNTEQKKEESNNKPNEDLPKIKFGFISNNEQNTTFKLLDKPIFGFKPQEDKVEDKKTEVNKEENKKIEEKNEKPPEKREEKNDNKEIIKISNNNNSFNKINDISTSKAPTNLAEIMPSSQTKKRAIPLAEAMKEIDDFSESLDKLEKDISAKYGITFPELSYEKYLPENVKLKIVEEFFERPDIKELFTKIQTSGK